MTYQDLKFRAITWVLFPLYISSSGYLHYIYSIADYFILNCLINITLFILVIGITYLYTLFKLKKDFLKDAFGMGDILFFLGLAVGFPTVTFIIFFCATCLFSLSLHVILNFFRENSKKDETVPLAGYSAIFLSLIYIINLLGIENEVFRI